MKDLKDYKEQWRKDNPNKVKEYVRQWQRDNKEYLKEYKRQWSKDHRMNRYRTDLKYNLNYGISNAIRKSLRRNKNGYHWEDLVGYTLNDLIKRLKKTMPDGYNWNDYLSGKLQLDHIIPINAFNYTKSEHTDFKRCWALNNLRLLPAEENLIKNAKLVRPFQPALQI